ncbi:MAG: nicotianamine synthase family protein [Candidatus Altimarinota bacterium]
MISNIYKKLSVHKTLMPNEEVNGQFSELVNYVLGFNNFSDAEATKIVKEQLDAGQLLELQKICARGEGELEKYWAKLIIDGSKSIKAFPYYQNYVDLTELEMGLLDISRADWHKFPILFVGGGSLPMTAIMLAFLRSIKSTIVDSDEEAILLARQLVNKLGLSEMISIIKADGGTFDEYNNYSTIYVAALAGIDDDDCKRAIFQKIGEDAQTDQLLIARSSWGARKALYRPLPDISKFGFNQILKFDPQNEIVNSVVLFRKI